MPTDKVSNEIDTGITSAITNTKQAMGRINHRFLLWVSQIFLGNCNDGSK